MYSKVVVLPEDDFNKWLADRAKQEKLSAGNDSTKTTTGSDSTKTSM